MVELQPGALQHRPGYNSITLEMEVFISPKYRSPKALLRAPFCVFVCSFCLAEALYIAFFIFGMNEILLQTIKASYVSISAVSNNVACGRGHDLEDNRSSKGILLMS
jgi:hypothetical protein